MNAAESNQKIDGLHLIWEWDWYAHFAGFQWYESKV